MTDQILEVEEAYGPKAVAECALARRMLDEINITYPGYFWGVGVNHDAGVANIVLKTGVLRFTKGEPAYLIYLSTVVGPGGVKKTLDAAGEILERWRLPRGPAPQDWLVRVRETELDMHAARLKSKY